MRFSPIALLALAPPVLAACGDTPSGSGPEPVATVSVAAVGTLEVGQTQQLTAVARDARGNPLGGRAVTWSSSSEAVARVAADGVVTGVAPGEATITARSENAAGEVKVTVVPATPQTLRDQAARQNFWIGTAVGYTSTTFPGNAPYVEAIGREFNVAVTGNVMKWQTLRRDGRDALIRFQFGDEVLQYAESRGMRMRGHTLVWHSGLPTWLEPLQPQDLSRDEAVAMLQDHIARVVGRWKGRIYSWDVVNEAISDNAGQRRSPSESVWERLIGPDFIEIAFRAAALADPQAELVYNDYNIERPNTTKQNAVFDLLKDLRDRNVPVHAVGFQSHFTSGQVPTTAELIQSMDRFAALGLKVEMTELDIQIPNLTAAPTPQQLEQQAAEYRQVVQACIAHPACDTVVVWGIDDPNSWRASGYPLLFDAAFNKKPAYFSVLNLLAGR